MAADQVTVIPCPLCNSSGVDVIDTITISSFFKRLGDERDIRISARFKNDHSEYKIVRCSECGLTYSNPMIAGNAEFYQAVYAGMPPTARRWEFDAFLETIGTIFRNLGPRSETTVLDIGCGDGAFVRVMNGAGYACKGIDFNPDRLAAAQDAANTNDILSIDIGEITSYLAKEKFNIYTMWHVLEHLANPLEFFKQLFKEAPAQAVIAVSVPSDLFVAEKISDFNILQYPPHHLTRWSALTLKTLADQVELKVVTHRYEPKLGAVRGYAGRIARYCLANRCLGSLIRELFSVNLRLPKAYISPRNDGITLTAFGRMLALIIFFFLYLRTPGSSGMGQFIVLQKSASRK